MKRLIIILTLLVFLGSSCERARYKRLKKHKIRKPYPENGCWFGIKQFETEFTNKIKFS